MMKIFIVLIEGSTNAVYAYLEDERNFAYSKWGELFAKEDTEGLPLEVLDRKGKLAYASNENICLYLIEVDI